MFASLLSLLLFAPASVPQSVEDCAERPALCRTTQAYDLRVDGRSVLVDGGRVLPWVNEHGLLLLVGESVVLDIEGPKPVVESSARADSVLGEPLTAALIGAVAGTADELPHALTGDHLAMEGPPNRLRLSFRQATGAEDSLLTVENGYQGAVTYSAAMMIIGEDGGQWVATTVCTVPQGIYAFEHWPHAIVALTLSDFRIGPKGEAAEVVCR
jgi:hypothetical protein